MTPPMAPPIGYEKSFEFEEAGERQTTDGLAETLLSISEKTFADSGHASRSVHAKSHGLLTGTLRVLEGLPEELRQGIFANPDQWPAVIRLSTIPGDVLDDSVSTPRGFALKIVGAPGDRLPGSEGDVTQDFVMVNGPVFAAPGPKKFLGSLKLLASTTDRAPGLKKAISAVFRGAESTLEAFGSKSGTLIALGGHPETNILGETFYSQVPVLYGKYIAKVAIVPVSAGLTALAGARVDLRDRPNGLREAVVEHFAGSAGEWELRVQLCTNIDTMPIEDASVAWSETESPYRAVARLSVPAQCAWSDARSAIVDDAMAFSPWHGVADHRPLGAVMRVRKAAYSASAKFRAFSNHVQIVEPKTLDDLPS